RRQVRHRHSLLLIVVQIRLVVVILAAAPGATAPVQADASVTDQAGAVCVVMVADCLPVLLCDAQGRA
ncbi:laccase domain-containing protein, partial [Burkholderia cenocepacia]|nr:laccase domain-containing protein [Burkholderia cenocepacia]